MTDPSSSSDAGRQHLLRAKSDGGHARVTFVELFFDLVFVFAVTQLSHLLLHHLTLGGALQTLLLLLAVWWVWVYTSWVTNWLDPEATSVRLMLFALMLAGVVMASAIPKAFEARGLWFAVAYVAMQVGRSLYMLWVLRGHSPANYRNFQRITTWLSVSAALWLAGGLAEGQTRFALWAVAMLLEVISPSLGFWTPGLGRSTTADWDIAGGHLAERCGLFIIIALGESILLTGASFADLTWDATTVAAFCVCVIGSIAMWWIYFNIGAERASRLIAASTNPGALGRLAYTYLHVVIVAGIIVCAVSDEIMMKHPAGHHDVAASLVLVGGPALFLLGCLLFKWVTAGWPPLSHLGGIGLLTVLLAASAKMPTLILGTASTLVLLIVAIWETTSLKRERETLRSAADDRAHAPGRNTP